MEFMAKKNDYEGVILYLYSLWLCYAEPMALDYIMSQCDKKTLAYVIHNGMALVLEDYYYYYEEGEKKTYHGIQISFTGMWRGYLCTTETMREAWRLKKMRIL
jgi:hypothetical protein